eukprot:g3937.t1
MVGTSVVVEGARFQVRRVLAEGGKAIVFQVQEDGGSGKTYAMKRVVVSGDQDRSVLEAANREVEVLRRFAPAENIVNLRAAERKADRKRRLYFYFIVMAFCPKTVLSIMREAKGRGARGIARPVVLQIMRDTCRGVLQMHLSDPPLAHRDIKVENVLLDEYSNRYQLCDFGSATSVFESWGRCPASERSRAMEDIESNTTVEYRAPEQCDFLLSHRVDHRVDAWALGCMMFHLMYFRTPFEGGTKLQVMNVDYKFPASKQTDLNRVIKRLLVADPDSRMTVGQLLSTLCKLGQLEEPPEIAIAKAKGIYEAVEGGEPESDKQRTARKHKKSKKEKKSKKKKKKKKKKKEASSDSDEAGSGGEAAGFVTGGAARSAGLDEWDAFGVNSGAGGGGGGGGGDDNFGFGWEDDGSGGRGQDGFGEISAASCGDWDAEFSSLDFGSFGNDPGNSKHSSSGSSSSAPSITSNESSSSTSRTSASGVNFAGAAMNNNNMHARTSSTEAERLHRSEPHRGRYGSDSSIVGDLLGFQGDGRPSAAALLKEVEGEKKIYWDRRILPTYEDAVRALTGSFTVYVGNLSFFTSELQIHAAFTPCGPVRSVIMGLNRVTKSPCGFCFVEFFSHRAATDAVALLHGSKIEGRQIKVELDPGFTEGRQYGRGKTGGQVADHSRKGFDAGRGGWSVQSGERRARHGGGGWSGGRGGGHGGRRRGGRNNFRNGRGGGWQNQSGEARVLGVKRKHDEFRSYNPRFRDDHSDDERDDLDERDDRVPNQ